MRNHPLILEFVSKEKLGPYFGFSKPGLIQVRSDLPENVRQFVYYHELYHVKNGWGFWNEIGGTLYAARKCPRGFIPAVWMTITSKERWKLYWNRIRWGF